MMHETFDRPRMREQRHSPNRRKTRVEALADFEGTLHPVTILDISYEGMKLALPVLVFPGSPVAVHACGQRIRGIVHWYRLGHAGLHLIDRLDAKTLVELETAADDLAAYR
jgi:hypothetical protein